VLDRAGLARCLQEGGELQWRQEGALLSLFVDLGCVDELGGVAEQDVVAHARLVERAHADEVLADVGLRPRLGLAPAYEQLDVRALGLQGRQVVLQAPVDVVLDDPSLLVEGPPLVRRQEPCESKFQRIA